jgi:hypothetical protein
VQCIAAQAASDNARHSGLDTPPGLEARARERSRAAAASMVLDPVDRHGVSPAILHEAPPAQATATAPTLRHDCHQTTAGMRAYLAWGPAVCRFLPFFLGRFWGVSGCLARQVMLVFISHRSFVWGLLPPPLLFTFWPLSRVARKINPVSWVA